MSNPYFIFKRFTVRQDRCAMKVCSDACLFGAWVAQEMVNDKSVKFILDIGTGTGLLSLMLAQKTAAAIDAIDVDENAYLQAKENVAASEWPGRIRVVEADAGTFRGHQKYDLIIANPPFFESDLHAASGPANLAKHDTGLTLAVLIKCISANISRKGIFAVLLPYQRMNHFLSMLEPAKFSLLKRMDVRQSTRHGYFRSMAIFGGEQLPDAPTEEIAIKDGSEYTPQFVELLKEYYLYL